MAMLDIDGAIRSRAYQFWQAEGQQPGRDLDHWLRAEAEIKGAAQAAGKPAGKPAKQPASSPARKPASKARAKA
jgi:hypothetical protein